MKGILLAGGSGTRLGPITWATSKQLLPVYDKPMIYYPLSVLMLAGITEIAIITRPEDSADFRAVLGDGKALGLDLVYLTQDSPRGIADAFLVAADEVEGDSVCLILGDNLFHGQGFIDDVRRARSAVEKDGGACIFGYPVTDPSSFGVVELDAHGAVVSLEEKPAEPRSMHAVPGLYFYDAKAVEMARALAPSDRGELEITDLNQSYLERGGLRAIEFGRGMAWLDTGTPKGLLQASQFVETIQARQGLYIACIEEVAWRQGLITTEQFEQSAERYGSTEYARYIRSIATLGKQARWADSCTTETLEELEALPAVPLEELATPIDLRVFSDGRGDLVPFELEELLPFAPRRAWIISRTTARTTRGGHGHFLCWQCLWCIAGSARVTLSDGTRRVEVTLESPGSALVVPPKTWVLLDSFNQDGIVCVLASHPFDADDYYDELTPPSQ